MLLSRVLCAPIQRWSRTGKILQDSKSVLWTDCVPRTVGIIGKMRKTPNNWIQTYTEYFLFTRTGDAWNTVLGFKFSMCVHTHVLEETIYNGYISTSSGSYKGNPRTDPQCSIHWLLFTDPETQGAGLNLPKTHQIWLGMQRKAFPSC